MNKSFVNKLPILIFSIILFFIFYEFQDDFLKGKLSSNDTLLLKYEEFKKGGIEKEISLSNELIQAVIDRLQ